MRPNPALKRLASATLSVIACATLTACGGGGSTDVPAMSTPDTKVTEAPAPIANTANQPSFASSDEQLASAMATDTDTDTASVIDQTPIQVSIPSAIGEYSTRADTPDKAALSYSSSVLNTQPAIVVTDSIASTPSATSTAGTVYYVDSKVGSDSNSGSEATQGSAGNGPWRTLSKIGLTALQPGDEVRLTCGSEWNETLKVASSGTATSPITITTFPSTCATRPAINGSTILPPTSWTQHQGNIYKAPLAQAPFQLFNSSGYLSQAHHPNRGFEPSLPNSMYLRLASDSDNVLIGNRKVSTYVTTGADLKLPAGTSLTVGTQVRIRTNSWVIDDTKISAISGSRLTLLSPTEYPILAGWGYYLLGQFWMLDSAGEWHYDAAQKQIYAWMPNSQAPTTSVVAGQLALGIDLQSKSYVQIDGIAIRYVGTGINLRNSIGVAIKNSVIEDTADMGADAAISNSASFDSNTFRRTGNNAISGQDNSTAAATGMRVTNNSITDSGVVMNGEVVLSLPKRTYAAIRSGLNSIVNGNTLVNTGNIGIKVMAGSTVTGNYIRGACSVLDDCGAIYTSWTNNNSSISGNLIERSRGAVEGKSTAAAYTQAQGIYLDEYASGVTVSNNTITDNDNGIQLHVAANNLIQNNKLFGNRRNQIWLQETRNKVNSTGDVFGNKIIGNQFVPTTTSARGILAETQISSTVQFGIYDWNKYFDKIFPAVAVEKSPAAQTEYILSQWKAAENAGASRNLDTNGSGASQARFSSVLIDGANFVPNGNVSANTQGWTTWNLTAPYGQMVREPCAVGTCVRYITGGSPGMLTSPNFSIIAGKWYRLTVDLATGADNQIVQVVVRRGGGGTNGYESLSSKSLTTTAGRTWARYSKLFLATKTINAADPLTKDLGARVDFQQIQPGQVVSVANLEIVPITPAEALTRIDLVTNPGTSATQASCPVAATNPGLCTKYVRLTDEAAITWPYLLSARSSEIVYTRDWALVDTDGDGVPDSQDACSNTALGFGVNSAGCTIGQ